MPSQGSCRRQQQQQQMQRRSKATFRPASTSSEGPNVAAMRAAASAPPAEATGAATHAAATSHHTSFHQHLSYTIIAAAADLDSLCDRVMSQTNKNIFLRPAAKRTDQSEQQRSSASPSLARFAAGPPHLLAASPGRWHRGAGPASAALGHRFLDTRCLVEPSSSAPVSRG